MRRGSSAPRRDRTRRHPSRTPSTWYASRLILPFSSSPSHHRIHGWAGWQIYKRGDETEVIQDTTSLEAATRWLLQTILPSLGKLDRWIRQAGLRSEVEGSGMRSNKSTRWYLPSMPRRSGTVGWPDHSPPSRSCSTPLTMWSTSSIAIGSSTNSMEAHGTISTKLTNQVTSRQVLQAPVALPEMQVLDTELACYKEQIK